jgi:hypothetical protein
VSYVCTSAPPREKNTQKLLFMDLFHKKLKITLFTTLRKTLWKTLLNFQSVPVTPWCQNPRVHHRIHKSLPTIPIPRQVNSTPHPPPPADLPKLHMDPTLPSTPWSSEWSLSY